MPIIKSTLKFRFLRNKYNDIIILIIDLFINQLLSYQLITFVIYSLENVDEIREDNQCLCPIKLALLFRV